MKDQKVPAVFKEDLINLLTSINENERIVNEQATCIICSRVITYDNIQLIIPRAERKYEYVCNDIACISAYNGKKEETK